MPIPEIAEIVDYLRFADEDHGSQDAILMAIANIWAGTQSGMCSKPFCLRLRDCGTLRARDKSRHQEMMRVQVNESPRECTLKVEGEIAGIAVDELARFWRDLTCSCSTAMVVDVTDVIRIDRKARELLRSMHQAGVRFIGGRLAIQDILDEVTSDGNFGD